MHPLLKRQLRKAGVTPGEPVDAAALDRLLQRVNQAYLDVDQERYVMERSQSLATAEMATMNQALQTSRARLASLVSLSSDWIWEQDAQGRFVSVSDDLMVRTGIDPQVLLGQRLGEHGHLRIAPKEKARLQALKAARQTFRHVNVELTLPRSGAGAVRHLRISGEPLLEGQQLVGWRGVGSDVTAAVQADRKLQEVARYDSLTGLPNRFLFMEELGRALRRAQRQQRRFALMFFDLDRFKAVNDTLGHDVGDELLVSIGRRLMPLLRQVDMLGRLGGDEFMVLTEGLCDVEELSAMAQRLLAGIAEPLVIKGRTLRVRASIGISVFPDDGADGATLMRHADTAMYQAKIGGKGGYEFFSGQLAQRAAHDLALEQDLRQAIPNEELVLHFQPQVCAGSNRLLGLEALVRWQHPKRGLLQPSEFIELAETTGLIVPLGRWVLNEACRQLAQWRAQGLEPPRCAVNVSACQLADEQLVDDVRAALDRHALLPEALELEVTESALMADSARADAILRQLCELGVRVAIDDFGTGYSSLSYLKRFAAQTLKIDRSFVQGLPEDADDLAITRSVVALGGSIGMQVVAEGVETEAQRRCLRDMGCHVLQGYLFGQPEPAQQIGLRLRARLLDRQAARV